MSTLQDKFKNIQKKISETLLEREAEVELLLTALLCQENVLLIGAPGLAKTQILEQLIGALKGTIFSTLLTKHTEPAELFGPLDIPLLKEGKYLRNTTNKLPEAMACYLDEIWKSSSAILNTLLKILNERIYDKGDGVLRKTPLRICVASSNEWPNSENEGKELGAIFDRFLFRKTVKSIGRPTNREKLLFAPRNAFNVTWTPDEQVSKEELDLACNEAVDKIKVGPEVQAAFLQIIDELQQNGICSSDRRLRKSVHAVKANAYLHGLDEIELRNLCILEHILWTEPIEQPSKAQEIIYKIADPVGQSLGKILNNADEIISKTNIKNMCENIASISKLKDLLKELKKLNDVKRTEVGKNYIESIIRKCHLEAVSNM